MGYFDTDGDGHINFDEFLVGIRVRTFLAYNGYRENSMLRDKQ